MNIAGGVNDKPECRVFVKIVFRSTYSLSHFSVFWLTFPLSHGIVLSATIG